MTFQLKSQLSGPSKKLKADQPNSNDDIWLPFYLLLFIRQTKDRK